MDSAYPGIVPQLIAAGLAGPEAFPQCFNSHIEANFIPELERVNDGLSGVVDAHLAAGELMDINALSEGFSRRINEPHAQCLDPRPPSAIRKGHPDFIRLLGPDFMKTERRKEAYDPFWNKFGRLQERAVFLHLAGEPIETPACPLNDLFPVKIT